MDTPVRLHNWLLFRHLSKTSQFRAKVCRLGRSSRFSLAFNIYIWKHYNVRRTKFYWRIFQGGTYLGYFFSILVILTFTFGFHDWITGELPNVGQLGDLPIGWANFYSLRNTWPLCTIPLKIFAYLWLTVGFFSQSPTTRSIIWILY